MRGHTPGPWVLGVGGQDDGRRSLTVTGMPVYAVGTNHPETGPGWESIWCRRSEDARLVAKAPEMYAALHEIGYGTVEYDDMASLARRALEGLTSDGQGTSDG